MVVKKVLLVVRRPAAEASDFVRTDGSGVDRRTGCNESSPHRSGCFGNRNKGLHESAGLMIMCRVRY